MPWLGINTLAKGTLSVTLLIVSVIKSVPLVYIGPITLLTRSNTSFIKSSMPVAALFKTAVGLFPAANAVIPLDKIMS